MKGDRDNFVCLDNYIQINEGTDLYNFPNVFYSMFCIFYLVWEYKTRRKTRISC